MILGIGNDLTDMRRIERAINRFGNRFLERVYTPYERDFAHRRKNTLNLYFATYAKRFAAKEATAKALGTGIGQGVGWQDIEIRRSLHGAPMLNIRGAALVRLHALTPPGYRPCSHLTLSDEGALAMAQVILSAVVGDKGNFQYFCPQSP